MSDQIEAVGTGETEGPGLSQWQRVDEYVHGSVEDV